MIAAQSLAVYTLVIPNPEWTDDTEEDQVNVGLFIFESLSIGSLY